MPGPGFLENARREIKSNNVCVESAQVFRNVSWTTTQVANQAVALRGKLLQQLPLQRPMIELAGNLARIRTRQSIVIGTDFIDVGLGFLIHSGGVGDEFYAARVTIGSNS